MTTDGNNFNKKKYASVMVGIAVIIIGLVYFNGELKQGQINQFVNLNQTVTQIDVKQNVTDKKLDTGFRILVNNQKVLAQGINSMGDVIIGNISEIDAKTDLIPEIKFNTERIINQELQLPDVNNTTSSEIVGNLTDTK